MKSSRFISMARLGNKGAQGNNAWDISWSAAGVQAHRRSSIWERSRERQLLQQVSRLKSDHSRSKYTHKTFSFRVVMQVHVRGRGEEGGSRRLHIWFKMAKYGLMSEGTISSFHLAHCRCLFVMFLVFV